MYMYLLWNSSHCMATSVCFGDIDIHVLECASQSGENSIHSSLKLIPL